MDDVDLRKSVSENINSNISMIAEISHASVFRSQVLELKRQLEAGGEGACSIHDQSHTTVSDTIGSILKDLDQYFEEPANSSRNRDDSQFKRLEATAKCQGYLRCVEKVENCCIAVEESLASSEVDTAILEYRVLVNMAEKLRLSHCNNLKQYLEESITHWFKQIKSILNQELVNVMKLMQWPFVSALSSKTQPTITPTDQKIDVKAKLQTLFKQLLDLQLPAFLEDRSNIHPLILSLPNYRSCMLPMSLLLDPLKKRFQYHFYGNKQTNNLDKPEWYFTQVLSWIKSHTDYLSTVIQPILWKSGYSFVNANFEFMRGLQFMVMEKMISALPDLLSEEHRYAHFIFEALSFHKEICDVYEYPAHEVRCLHVLTAEDPFRKWLSIEQKFAIMKMDQMTGSASAWESHFSPELDGDDELTKAPECAESFITLLAAITERYEVLPYPLCQLMFVDVQKNLLDDFRIRMVQLRKEYAPESPQYAAILNSTHILVLYLQDCSDKEFFIRLQFHYNRLQKRSHGQLQLASYLSRNASYQMPEEIDANSLEDLNGSLFDDTISNILSLQKDMVTTLINQIVADVKPKILRYADTKESQWTALNHLKLKEEQQLVTLSTSGCSFMLQLQEFLSNAKSTLHKTLFDTIWQSIAAGIDDLIFNMVLSENHFSEGGIFQFNFDMTRNLFPLFGKHTVKPENFLKRVKEGCQILSLKLGDALLLKGVLNDALHSYSTSGSVQDPIEAIQEIGVFKLSPEEVELVLSRRNDLLRG